ncbi:hypothetical protein [Methanoregula sp.]|jgi:uncharacterized membrane protein HdeD (DUF308 family)|uniref:hypothetical protein n=1 Tax=Methanoregula sp. TaxID=2052170 RepID=UPI003C1DF413
MDAKLSHLLKGLTGVIFGGLALVVPAQVLAFFTGVFWILLIGAFILCIIIAITAHADESIFWFLCSAALLVIGIVEMLFPETVSLIFVLVVALLALYAGYTGIMYALTRPHSKYLMVIAAIASSVVLFLVFITYVPAMRSFFIMTVVGTISLVLGLFAILMGLSIKEGEILPVTPRTFIIRTCQIQINSADQTDGKESK